MKSTALVGNYIAAGPLGLVAHPLVQANMLHTKENTEKALEMLLTFL